MLPVIHCMVTPWLFAIDESVIALTTSEGLLAIEGEGVLAPCTSEATSGIAEPGASALVVAEI